MHQYNKLYIGGQWCDAISTERIEVLSPATEAVIGTVPAAGAADVDAAVAAAKLALPGWAATSPQVRGGCRKSLK